MLWFAAIYTLAILWAVRLSFDPVARMREERAWAIMKALPGVFFTVYYWSIWRAAISPAIAAGPELTAVFRPALAYLLVLVSAHNLRYQIVDWYKHLRRST